MTVHIDFDRIRANVQDIRQRTAVSVYAVVKADAYGLGARAISQAVADLVDGFCVYSLREAAEAELWNRTAKPSILLGPPDSLDPDAYLREHARPAVSTIDQAAALRRANPLLCVDTGMQRFACPPEQIDEVLRAGDIHEAFTHAARIEQVRRLVDLLGGRSLKLHAAASALLDDPAARLDAVRPGLALYRAAVRITAPLLEARDSVGLVGYTGFQSARHGVILGGYSAGLRKGLCLVNGRPQFIPEVGMQSAYVTLAPQDHAGDEVVLLGDALDPETVAKSWACTPHEVLLRLTRGSA